MKLVADWLQWPEVMALDKAFADAGHTLRFVGGCVRDTLMQRPVTEIDAATDATPETMMALLEKTDIRALPTGLQHGTVTALVHNRTIEITTLRSDVATDGRHAEIAFTQDWAQDAKRRDFTINAIYADVSGELFDPVGGIADCAAGRLCFIGDADARVKEDYLRILRYFRFLAQLAIGEFDDAALAACRDNKEGIAQLSGERIHNELFKLLTTPHAYPIIRKMDECGVLAAISTTLTRVDALRRLEEIHSSNPLLKLAVLLGDAPPSAITERLKLSGKQAKQIVRWLVIQPRFTPDLTEPAQKKLLRAYGAEDYLAATQIAYAHSGRAWEEFIPLTATAKWEPPAFPVSAKDLLAAGFEEGKPLGDTLKKLETKWEESGYTLTRDALLSLV